MNFYAFDEIKSAHALTRFVREILGLEINSQNRCKAAWRGGDGYNVALTDDTWYDHKTKEGGGIIELCAIAKFNGGAMAKQQAQEMLGNWLGLTPRNKTVRKTFDYRTQSLRYRELVQAGYEETKKYTYTDENGTPAHLVVRLEHPTNRKQFLQCTPYSGSLRDCKTYLYNLPQIAASDWAVVVEGEKDADSLIALGIPATTCNNGADNWKDEYTETLRGKDVVICRDNDDAGLDHAHLVLRSLADAARTLRLVCPSRAHKGDVTDWLQNENGTKEKFLALIKKAQVIAPDEAQWSDEALMLYRAKKANETPFANFIVEEKMVKGKPQFKEIPRTVAEMLDDLFLRFLNFPRRLGGNSLFDHDRDSDTVEILGSNAALFAWIGQKSKHSVNWKQGAAFVSKEEFYQAVMRNARRYEKISEVPDYPMRSDVYYTFRSRLKPTKDFAAFNRFMAFFNPEDRASEILMRTIIAGMMYFRPGIQRPNWIIDSKGGQAAGKTTFAELLCVLYKCKPIKTSVSELKYDAKEITKRLVSTTGRNSRMFLVDNVTGIFNNEFFSDLVTGFDISGKAPYGVGEESRPNDLTYVITSNSANIGTDIASRSFMLFVAQPKRRDPDWKTAVLAFIEKNRYSILGDIYAILDGELPEGGENIRPATRVPEFERDVLLKMCGSVEIYNSVIASLLQDRDSANVDSEIAIQAEEIVRDGLKKVMQSHENPNIDQQVFFIRVRALEFWLKKPLGISFQDLRNMANIGRLRSFLREPVRFPQSSDSPYRASGLVFVGKKPILDTKYNARGEPVVTCKVNIIGMLEDGKIVRIVQIANKQIADVIQTAVTPEAADAIDAESEVVEPPPAPSLPAPPADTEPPEDFEEVF